MPEHPHILVSMPHCQAGLPMLTGELSPSRSKAQTPLTWGGETGPSYRVGTGMAPWGSTLHACYGMIWLRCRGHNLEQPWVFPKPRYLFDPTPCSQQLRLCFWRLWFSRVAQAGSSSGHGASALPTDKLLRVSLVPCDILGLSRRKQRTEEVCRCWTEEQLLLVAGSSRGLLQHAETPPNPASWNISVKLLSSYTVTVSYSSYLPR